MHQNNRMTTAPRGPIRSRGQKQNDAVNKYYLAVSVRFKLLKYLTLFLLIIFILTMLSTYRESITYNNLRYLMRDLDEAIKSGAASIMGTIRYDVGGRRSFSLYRGNLSIAGESKLTIYNASGRQLLSRSFAGGKPIILSSSKYLLVYDLGGNQFAVYNLLTELYSETFDYPISGAAVADNGTFAILTQTLEHRSAVYLYDKNFNLIGKYLKDKHVIDIELKKDGSELLILSFYADGGDYVTEITGYTPKESSEKYKILQHDYFPLKANFFKDGGYSITGDSAIIFYNKDGELIATYPYGGMSLISADAGDSGIVAVFNKNIVGRENSAVIFDTEGNIRYNNNIGDTCVDLKFWGDYVYMLTETEAIRISQDDGTTSRTKIESGAQRLLVYDERTLLVCYSSRTQTVRIAD